MKNRSELFASGFFPDEEFLPYSSDYNILYNIRSQDIYFAVRYQSQPPNTIPLHRPPDKSGLEHLLQQKVFRQQMDIAREKKLPFMIHSRDAAEDTLNIVKEYMQDGMYGGVIHCFSYSKEIAREYLNMGLYLGIGGVVTFKNSRKLKEVAEYAPLNQILLETDCPYMAPVPNRGKRNSSLYLPEVVKTIAEIKGISCEEVVAVTESNALKVLNLI